MNTLDKWGYALRGSKCVKNVKATVPGLTLTVAVTPYEIIGLSFVANSNITIYVSDFIRDVMMKLRKR